MPGPSRFIVFGCFSVDRSKRYKNASVDENILLRFAVMKMDTFENELVWMVQVQVQIGPREIQDSGSK